MVTGIVLGGSSSHINKTVASNWLWRVIWLCLLVMLATPDTSFARKKKKFDHDKTGYSLSGAHIKTKCASCHVRGIFKGTPKTCGSCHTQGGRVKTTFKTQNHVKSTDSCGECHSESTWKPAKMSHAEVTGSCSNCHNGTIATGKTTSHVSSSGNCQSCHSTSRWTPAKTDHAEVTGSCSTCHNGTIATGKDPGHSVTTEECDACHNTIAFADARVNHSNLTQACVACHVSGGSATTFKNSTHITSTDNCESCHFAGSGWKPLKNMDHAEVTGTCLSCHDGSTTGQSRPATHSPPITETNCQDCHKNFKDWADVTFTHPNPVVGLCSQCHGVTATGKGAQHIYTIDDCVSCHAIGSKWLNPTYTHNPGTGYPGKHAAEPGCLSCHTSPTLPTFSWRTPAAAGTCGGCHVEKYTQAAVGGDPHKGETLIVNKDCTAACHKPGTGELIKGANHHNITDNNWKN